MRTWKEFKHFTSALAFSLQPADQTALHYGTANVAGETAVDIDKRIVTIRSPKVTDVTFTKPVPAAYTTAVMEAATRESFEVPLDLFLAYVAEDVFLPQEAPAGFNTSPPPILVRSTPTALLFVNGAPVPVAVPNTGLEVIVNANWPLYRRTGAARITCWHAIAGSRLTSWKLAGRPRRRYRKILVTCHGRTSTPRSARPCR